MHYFKAALLIASAGLVASDAIAEDMNVKRQSWQDAESAALSSASVAAAEASCLADLNATRAQAPVITPSPMLNRFHGKRQDWKSIVSNAESIAASYESFAKTVADDYTSDAAAIASSAQAYASSVVSNAESVAATAGASGQAAASSAVASAESVAATAGQAASSAAASAGASASSSSTQDSLAARGVGSFNLFPTAIIALAVGCLTSLL